MPAIGVHHTTTVNVAWDGPAAVAAMPESASVLHYCMGWQDNDAGDVKANYKFPHHKSDGAPANIPGCRNGLARLAGSSIPGSDKGGVRSHLQTHLNDYNKKAGNSMSAELKAFWNQAVSLGMLSSEDRVRQHAPRVQLAGDGSKPWFRFSNSTDAEEAVLDLQDEIGFWGVTASDFARQLADVTAPSIHLRVNSPGGDVFDGVAIANLLRAHRATVNASVYGLAASAASFICMAADSVTMMPNSNMMIHDAMGGCRGNAGDMRELADLLDKVSDNIASMYAAKAGGEASAWRDVMRGEQWYDAQEAVDAGLADHIGEPGTSAAENALDDDRKWNMSFYRFDNRQSAAAPSTIAAKADITPAAAPKWDALAFLRAWNEGTQE